MTPRPCAGGGGGGVDEGVEEEEGAVGVEEGGGGGCAMRRSDSSSCSPQSHRIDPSVSPVKHSEWILTSGTATLEASFAEAAAPAAAFVGAGAALPPLTGSNRPTYAPGSTAPFPSRPPSTRRRGTDSGYAPAGPRPRQPRAGPGRTRSRGAPWRPGRICTGGGRRGRGGWGCGLEHGI